MPEGQKFYSKNLADLGGGTFQGIEKRDSFKKKGGKNKKKGGKFKKEEEVLEKQQDENREGTPGAHYGVINVEANPDTINSSSKDIRIEETPVIGISDEDRKKYKHVDIYDYSNDPELQEGNATYDRSSKLIDKIFESAKQKNATINKHAMESKKLKPTNNEEESVLNNTVLINSIEKEYDHWVKVLSEAQLDKKKGDRNKRELKELEQNPLVWITGAITNIIKKLETELSTDKTEEDKKRIEKNLRINRRRLDELQLASNKNLEFKWDVEHKKNEGIEKEKKLNLIEEGTIVTVKRAGVKRNVVYKIGKKNGENIPFDNLTDGTRGHMTMDQMRKFLFAPGIDFVLNRYNKDIKKEPEEAGNESTSEKEELVPEQNEVTPVEPITEEEQAPDAVGGVIPESVAENKEAEVTAEEIAAQYWAGMAELEKLEAEINEGEENPEVKIDMEELEKVSPNTAALVDLLGPEVVEKSMNAVQAQKSEDKNGEIEVPTNIEEYENLLKTDKVFFNQEYMRRLSKIKDFDENMKFRNSSDEEVIQKLLEIFKDKNNATETKPIENKEENQVEILDKEQLRKEIEKVIKKFADKLKKNNIAYKGLDIRGTGKGFHIVAHLTGTGLKGIAIGNPDFIAEIESDDGKITVANYKLDANNIVKAFTEQRDIDNLASTLGEEIKKYIEADRKKSVERIDIENNSLKITYK